MCVGVCMGVCVHACVLNSSSTLPQGQLAASCEAYWLKIVIQWWNTIIYQITAHRLFSLLLANLCFGLYYAQHYSLGVLRKYWYCCMHMVWFSIPACTSTFGVVVSFYHSLPEGKSVSYTIYTCMHITMHTCKYIHTPTSNHVKKQGNYWAS